MNIEPFDKLLNRNNGVPISEDLVIYKNYELYNYKTEESKRYDNIYDLVNDNPHVKKIIEDTENFCWRLD